MRRVLFVITILMLSVTACAPQSAPTEQPSIIIERPTAAPTHLPVDLTPAQLAAVTTLSKQLSLPAEKIKLVSTKAVTWSDGCLGVEMPDLMCAQVVTPGHIVVLEANGIQYEYHTSADGIRVQPATFALTWKREGGIAGFCDNLTVFRSGEVYASSCNSQSDGRMGTLADLLSTSERMQFDKWLTAFGEANLEASDPVGVADRMVITLNVFGSGSKQPTESEKQTLFEFAQNLYQKVNQ